MQQKPQESRPRPRSAFASAFLSLVFPGLGHAYAGAWGRALGFGALPILAGALLAGLALSVGIPVLGAELAANLPTILLANLLILLYRVVAAVDAYRVAAYVNAVEVASGGRLGPARLRLSPVSLAGLLAVCLVIAGGHGVVAYYGSQAQATLSCVFDPTGTAVCDAGGSADASNAPSTDAPATPAPGSAAPMGTALPTSAIPTWNGTDRLNILLIGTDQRPNQGTFNTDTLIVVSIDPISRQVAMFSLPRDTVDVPIPAGPAQSVFGTLYRGKINSLWMNASGRPDAFPGNDRTRGANALKSAIGELYGIDIQYYVEVNFDGFRSIVDTIGGVTINVQNPVLDDHYPGDHGTIRVYIPAGVQHMDGAQALIYARERKTQGESDFTRAQRQQRVILSIRQQADPATVLANLSQLLTDLQKSFKTDIPQGKLPQLIGLSSRVDSTNVHSFVFSPPRYGTQGTVNGTYVIEPDVAAIRQAVATAFKVDPKLEAQREKVAGENGVVWVVNGSGQIGQASQIASYLEYLGLTSSAPNQRPDTTLTTTRIRVYNGRETALPSTIALLENVFNVKAVFVADPSVRVDIIVTTGTGTPDLSPPPAP
jgi:LCP family protein required for cell wall assembly